MRKKKNVGGSMVIKAQNKKPATQKAGGSGGKVSQSGMKTMSAPKISTKSPKKPAGGPGIKASTRSGTRRGLSSPTKPRTRRGLSSPTKPRTRRGPTRPTSRRPMGRR